MPAMEAGIQFHLPTYAHVPLPHLVDLAKQAETKGGSQIWVTVNLLSRNTFVVLAALASHLKVKLGTARHLPLCLTNDLRRPVLDRSLPFQLLLQLLLLALPELAVALLQLLQGVPSK